MRSARLLTAFVRRSGDRRLERTLGSDGGLRLIFRAMASRFDPGQAEGFTGDIGYELRRSDGRVRSWTVTVGPERAVARPGRGTPALTVKVGVADFVRLAARELDPGSALLEGRLDVEGDFALATRLGAMFGQPSAF